MVKRPTIPTRGYFLVFRLWGSWRCRRPGSWPDVISVHWRRPHVSAPHPERGSVAMGMAMTAGVELSSAAEKPIGALVPSSARRRLNGERAPVRPRCGCGAAHVNRARRPPHVQEPERASTQRTGLRAVEPTGSYAVHCAVAQCVPRMGARLIPSVASEAPGAPTPLRSPVRNVGRSNAG